jgi:hypothetical protein
MKIFFGMSFLLAGAMAAWRVFVFNWDAACTQANELALWNCREAGAGRQGAAIIIVILLFAIGFSLLASMRHDRKN